MSGPFSNITETIFADKSVLTESYQPETILERDEEIESYSHALQDVLFGREPENVFLYGKAGLGKTAVTEYMMDELREEAATREQADDLHIHQINCNGRTLFMVVRQLVNRLLPEAAIDILPALKREDSHGTVPLGWDIVVYDVTCS